ncbi:MAG: GNAT family N-acetyltransferase [Nitrososphaerales archaeon]
MTFKARIARSEDYEAVANLCSRAVGPDDYVLPILRKIIDAHGLFLALDGKRVIGITNFQRTLDGSGWLSSARTDPDYWGKRVATFLQESIASKARGRGINTLRMWINKTNHASIRAGMRGGFQPVSEMIHLSRNVKSRSSKLVACKRDENPSAEEISEILSSNYIRSMNGFFAFNWQLVRASEKVIKAVARKGWLFKTLDEDAFFFPGDHEIWGRRQHNEFAPLKGPLDRSLNFMELYGPSAGAGSIGSFLPYKPHYIRVARNSHEFSVDLWGTHCILFEKAI